MDFNDTIDQLSDRLIHECKALEDDEMQRHDLAEGYYAFLDASARITERRKRIRRIKGLLTSDRFDDCVQHPEVANLAQPDEAPAHARKGVALWELLEELLVTAGEARVAEILTFLAGIMRKRVSRQALDAAIQAHRDLFKVRKAGSEKYVALKQRGIGETNKT